MTTFPKRIRFSDKEKKHKARVKQIKKSVDKILTDYGYERKNKGSGLTGYSPKNDSESREKQKTLNQVIKEDGNKDKLVKEISRVRKKGQVYIDHSTGKVI